MKTPFMAMAALLAAATSGDSGAETAPPAMHPPDVVAASLPLDLALEVARIATAACAGFHVSVSIIDAAGLPKLYYVPDGTAGNHAQMGFRKAKAALAFKLPSGRVGEMAHSDSAVAAKLAQDPDMVGYAGGLPIMKGAEIIGAVGVSGAMPSTKDEECARSGLDQIRDRLQ